MKTLILSLVIVILVEVALLAIFIALYKKSKETIKDKEESIIVLQNQINNLKVIQDSMEKNKSDAKKSKSKIKSGDNTVRVNNTADILHDIESSR